MNGSSTTIFLFWLDLVDDLRTKGIGSTKKKRGIVSDGNWYDVLTELIKQIINNRQKETILHSFLEITTTITSD